uniref:c-type cytochrome n=1 Tax=Altererythrobacter segetis TaxID=1104773 RepID=UPI0014094425|nr:cytochrome c [Altererythrobacter segetis]
MSRIALAALAALGLASVAMAQGMPKPTTIVDRPNATGGEKLYVEHCVMCHGPNGMGTGLLARRVQPALLEQRDNLAAAYVIMAARRGIGNMPQIPRGEVSDAELKQIADYLAAGPHGAAK